MLTVWLMAITSAIPASEPTTTPKGSIVETDEKEVVELISGDTRGVATTTQEPKLATLRHGKDGTGTEFTTEFQSSTREPTSTTPLHRIESTYSTTESSITTESTPIHEFSTTHTDTSGIYRVPITTSAITITDNTSDTSKQPTLSVGTNQPQDTSSTYTTTEKSRNTPYFIEVTNSLVVLQPGTIHSNESINLTEVSAVQRVTSETVGVVTSEVFHRGATSTPTLSSRITDSISEVTKPLMATGSGFVTRILNRIVANETQPTSLRSPIVTSKPIILSSTSVSPNLVTGTTSSFEITIDDFHSSMESSGTTPDEESSKASTSSTTLSIGETLTSEDGTKVILTTKADLSTGRVTPKGDGTKVTLTTKADLSTGRVTPKGVSETSTVSSVVPVGSNVITESSMTSKAYEGSSTASPASASDNTINKGSCSTVEYRGIGYIHSENF
ncbi:unnamed protein product [Strongylus vulgaris]|uniref:Uncharacterized protein n=1 Tax=Strongylus vulgaris TaxID=40348 RepID=A0A3P7JMM3_STRVU|nr:unnamed protein product [Strongylus vulgaris]